ncbi:MAG TPA: alpha/beta fold hydrolase [Acidimicrobiia bacterium]|nr:alpha/beta fold hydrolase [Acidimicrobiia bacterium]
MARVVLVPGFTQTAASWDAVRAELARRHPELDVLALEIPEADDFAATAAALADAGGPALWVGYSLGGRLLLRLAIDRPELVHGAVLVSTSAGIADPIERAERRAADDALSEDALTLGAERFLERWLAQPMFADVPDDAPGLADRSTLTPRFLAHCLRVLGTGVMDPLWDRLGELTVPVTIVTGAGDAKFDAIGVAMAERIRRAAHLRVEGGHALPLVAPVALAAIVAAAAYAVGEAT